MNKFYPINKNKNSISRKDALKRIGGLSFGLPFLSSMVGSFSAEGKQRGNPFFKNNKIKDKPNILWITTEGVPINALSCYGSKIAPTPNIDRIAKDGLLFKNSFCNNALCAPSRATLLTGKYNHLNGMYSNQDSASNGQPAATFDPKQENVARILKDNGYNTALVGKWHLPANPGEVGFDHFIYKEGAGGPYYKSTGFFESVSFGSTTIENKTYEGYGTDIFTSKAIGWMKDLQARKKPFFMAMQFFNDHRPFDPPHKYEHIYDDRRFDEPRHFLG